VCRCSGCSRHRAAAPCWSALDLYAERRTVLQFKVAGEEGTGEGPTRQFYTDVARALQRKSFCLWRCDHEELQHYDGPQSHVFRAEGLFPAVLPLDPDAADEVLSKFRLLGQLLARALQDGHLVDLPLSVALRKLMVGQVLGIEDLPEVDTSRAAVLLPLADLLLRKKALECRPNVSLKETADAVAALKVGPPHCCAVDELCLTMSYDQDELTSQGVQKVKRDLVPGGEAIEVGLDNLEQYLSRVVELLLREGISEQMQALSRGFNSVFPMRQLRVFSADELAVQLGGDPVMQWSTAELNAAITPQHGYDSQSQVYIDFIQMLTALPDRQKRLFLTWITGCPRQPVGGLSALRPKLTILRKSPPDNMDVADTMPSAQTCHHIIKMPPYANAETMRERLVTAITHPDVQQFLFN